MGPDHDFTIFICWKPSISNIKRYERFV